MALMSTSTLKDAAAQAKVSEVTLWRWLQDEDFAKAYRTARRQVVERAVAEMQATCGDAVETLKRNLNCRNESVAVRAAQIILDQAIKGVELIDLQERIERLEGLLAEQEKGKGKKWG